MRSFDPLSSDGAERRLAFPRPGRASGLLACALTATLACLLMGEPTFAEKETAPRTLSVQDVEPMHGQRVTAKARPDDLSQGASAREGKPAAWPKPGAAEVDLQAPAAGVKATRSGPVRAGSLPVWVSTPQPGARRATASAGAASRVGVELLDRAKTPATWNDGILVRLRQANAATSPAVATVAVDYSDFAGAFGADWGPRLRLLALPDCALTTPDAAECGATPVPSRNDAAGEQVSADVELPATGGARAADAGGVILAVAAGAAGESGDSGATPLQASSTWSAGSNSGDFSWNYPMRTPPAIGGPSPGVSLAYSSSSVDGRNESTNNQPSWIGEGFEYWPGYVERRYKPCGEDMGNGANNTKDTGDLCWATDNAVVSLNGRTTELIRNGANGVWRMKYDDGSRIERRTDTVNGDNNNEYWKITAPDGNQYFFGLNRLPGYTGTAPANAVTDSTWTVPVASNHVGEPCQATKKPFVASFCAEAWRWNLDYVLDKHGNTMSMWYSKEINRYARNLTDTDAQTYVRGGTLNRIEYGTHKRGGTDTVHTTANAPAQVTFGLADRCLANCTVKNDKTWPDTSWDQDCAARSCAGKYTPTFWSTKRLASVTTKIWSPGDNRYKDVEVWTLTHSFPDPGDGTRAGLWLESIAHKGKAAGAGIAAGEVSVPDINFDWEQLPNRTDRPRDNKLAMNWMRMSTIWTETGGKISVRYTAPECSPTNLPTSPAANTLRCYPVLELQADKKTIKTDYFHRYLVTSVTQADLTGGGPDVVTSYSYIGKPFWRHTDDDGITRDNLRTWAEFRGYQGVETRVGDPDMGNETLSVSAFFRGIHGDRNGAGGTRTHTLPAVDVNGDGDTGDGSSADARAVNDEDAYAGMVRQTTLYDGVVARPVSTTVNEPWQSVPTSTRDMGDTTVHARYTGVRSTWTGTHVATGGSKVTRTDNSHDTYGMVHQTNELGDVAVAGDERCTKTTFNRNTATNLLSLAGMKEVYALPCGQEPNGEEDVVSIIRSGFDGRAPGQAPDEGVVTKTEMAKAWAAAGASWLTSETKAYDDYGRLTRETNLRGNATTTAYEPVSGSLPTKVTTTNGLGWKAVNELQPAWGSAVSAQDVNANRSDTEYDSLGRIRRVWLPTHPKSTFPNEPGTVNEYKINSSGAVNAVVTQKLNANRKYVTSYALFDGLLRSRQTQSRSASNGHVGTVLTEKKYDAAGRVRLASTHFDDTVQPSAALYTIEDWRPKVQTETSYDRANRVVAAIAKSAGTELSRTTTRYGGDRVSVVPPHGGTATTTIADALGRTVELRHYQDEADVGSNVRTQFEKATYHYNQKGTKDAVTDNAGNTWRYSFDLLGRQIGTDDPDKGRSKAVFSDTGDLLSVTDSRNKTLAYTYDGIGRKTGEYTPTTAGAKLATWSYDPIGGKGQLASSSRWVDNKDEYRIRIRGYTALNQSTGEDYVIPAVESTRGLAGTYTVSRTYNVDGSPDTLSYPNAGELGAEKVTYTYDDVSGLAEQLKTNAPGIGQYVTNTDYTAFGEIGFVQHQLTAGNWLQRAFSYDAGNRSLSGSTTIRQLAPQAVSDTKFTRDRSGSIIGITEADATGAVDHQCFTYDGMQRLTEAWTPRTDDCATAPDVDALGGPAPYWQSWSFDTAGNRRTQTVHTDAGDATTTLEYPAAAGPQPHAVKAVKAAGPGVNATGDYEYDSNGATLSRPGRGGQQTLNWDVEGRLASIEGGGTRSAYVYAADGARLIAHDQSSTTVYLPATEIKRDNASGNVTATRYYSWAGQVCAMTSTGSGVTWLVADQHGTQGTAVSAGNQTVVQRRAAPYGDPRGATPAWPNGKGFVGGDNDPSGLTHLGAREYDPVTGAFISVDPVFDFNVMKSWSGYLYAGHNPVNESDPTGLCWLCDRAKDAGYKVVDSARNAFAAAWVEGVDTAFHAIGSQFAAADAAIRSVDDVIAGVGATPNGMGAAVVADMAWKQIERSSVGIIGTDADPTGIRLGWEWASGNGPKERVLNDCHTFTKTLQQHQNVKEARDYIASTLRAGKMPGEDGKGKWSYELGGSMGDSLRNLSSDFTSNQSAAVLGSYDLNFTVLAIDPKSGTATVEFEVTNDHDINSATHTAPALGGYSSWWDKHIAGPLNSRFEKGPMSRKDQKITWRETIRYKPARQRPVNRFAEIIRRISSWLQWLRWLF